MSDVLKQAAAAIREHANEIYESEGMEGGYWPSDAIGQNAKAEWERLIELARNVDSQSATIERLREALKRLEPWDNLGIARAALEQSS